MEVSFSIRVVNEDGDPVEGAKVKVWENVLMATNHPSEITDEDGWAYFTWETLLDDWFYVTVYVDGTEIERYTFYDGDSTSIVYPD